MFNFHPFSALEYKDDTVLPIKSEREQQEFDNYKSAPTLFDLVNIMREYTKIVMRHR